MIDPPAAERLTNDELWNPIDLNGRKSALNIQPSIEKGLGE